MSAVDELITFVRQQLDEDERVARDAFPGPWAAEPYVYGPPDEGYGEPTHYEIRASDGRTAVDHYPHEGGGTDRRNGEHIARWDPARVLAEVEAKRRVLDEAHGYSPELEHGDNGEWAFETVIKMLAQPYAGRPGWREEWRA